MVCHLLAKPPLYPMRSYSQLDTSVGYLILELVCNFDISILSLCSVKPISVCSANCTCLLLSIPFVTAAVVLRQYWSVLVHLLQSDVSVLGPKLRGA